MKATFQMRPAPTEDQLRAAAEYMGYKFRRDGERVVVDIPPDGHPNMAMAALVSVTGAAVERLST
jgi:hypothetical protein